MQEFSLTILGCSSAIPTSKRNPTSQILKVAGCLFLIDCGEATQIQLRRYKIKFQKIEAIFISHLHGDHYLGLMGLLSSMHLLGRTRKLEIFSPPGIKEIIDVQVHHSKTTFSFPLSFTEVKTPLPDFVYENEKVKIKAIPMNHRVPCYGYVFTEKKLSGHVIREKIEEYGLSPAEIGLLKSGKEVTRENGLLIRPEEIMLPSESPRSYCFCSDTLYDESIISYVQGGNLLYHEATFTEEFMKRAAETYHSTARQAANIAFKAGVKKLIIGHFSARYKDLDPLLKEAKSVFDGTVLAEEGMEYIVE